MWCDVLNKPKQGPAFHKDRSFLMNVPIDYDDDVERKQTHPDLLPQTKLNSSLAVATSKGGSNHRGSVLGESRIKRRRDSRPRNGAAGNGAQHGRPRPHPSTRRQ